MTLPIRVPFIKAHGAGNDFLFTFTQDLGEVEDAPALARALCQRNTGVGADGWYRIYPAGAEAHATIHLLNSDGSAAELSGNGTRCAAAILVERGLAPADDVRIDTGAGLRRLRLLNRQGPAMFFEMEMAPPRWQPDQVRHRLSLANGDWDVTLVDVGNPQCAAVVESLDFDWRTPGAEMEGHPSFPNRSNVSFLRPVDRHTIEARFYERGAGATLSSGTGSTGAAVAAILLGLAESPVTIRTEAGVMTLRWDSPTSSMYLSGPAEIIAEGEYHWHGIGIWETMSASSSEKK